MVASGSSRSRANGGVRKEKSVTRLVPLNGYENIDSNIFFEIKESEITRGHNFILVKKQSRLDIRKFSFSRRTINVWNKLSAECVHASGVNVFKNIIDKYLVKAGYT